MQSIFKAPTDADLIMLRCALGSHAAALNGCLMSTLHTNHPIILAQLEHVRTLLRDVEARIEASRAAGDLPLGLQDAIAREG